MPSISDLRRATEDRRLVAIREIVDYACERIAAGELTAAQARSLAGDVRFQVKLLIPDQMDTYDLIYGSRFARLTEQFAPSGRQPRCPAIGRTRSR